MPERIAKTSVLGKLYGEKRMNCRVSRIFRRDIFVKTLSKTMFRKDFLYICLNWQAALEHGKLKENIVNSSIFKGLGR